MMRLNLQKKNQPISDFIFRGVDEWEGRAI